MSAALKLVQAQYTALPITLQPSDCEGKTYIITGSNNGLGFEAAKHLVRMGSARVIVAVRNLKSGEAAKDAIESETDRQGVIHVWHVDLSSYESVAAFAKRVGEELDRVDGLIENAALSHGQFIEAEGNEMNMTVNVLSTILMALLVLPHLEKSAKKFGTVPRLSIVGSMIAFDGKSTLDKVDNEDILGYLRNRQKWEPEMDNSYTLSKLLLHFAFLELTRRAPFSRTGVVINLVNPGICHSGLSRNANFVMRLQIAFVRFLLARSTEVGSRTLLHGVTAGEEGHGKYLSECEIAEQNVPDWITNESGKQWQARVWEEVARSLDKAQPGCLDVLEKA